MSDRPAQDDSDNAAENTHGTGLGEEKFLHIAVARADGLHNSNFTTALENRHHQCVYNSDGSDGEGEAAENSQEHVEYGEKLLQTASSVEDGESIESHLLDCGFDISYLPGTFYPYVDGRVGRLVFRSARNFPQIRGLHHVQTLGKFERDKNSGASWTAHALGIKVGDPDYFKFHFSRHDGIAGIGGRLIAGNFLVW